MDIKYLEWLKEKYNVQESLCDVFIKDEEGNVKVEKRMAKKITSTIADYEKYCKENNIEMTYCIPPHVVIE